MRDDVAKEDDLHECTGIGQRDVRCTEEPQDRGQEEQGDGHEAECRQDDSYFLKHIDDRFVHSDKYNQK